jgi:phage-related protein
MSGDVIKEFLVSLGLQTEGAMDFDNVVGKATMTVAALGAATFAVAGAIFAFTKNIAEQYDALGELADRTDSAVGELEELSYVAQLTDSSAAAATSSIEGLTRAAGDAALGIGRSKKVFDQLGISVTDANGKLKNSTDLLYEIGDAVKDMERGQQIAILERLGIDKTMIKSITTDVGALRDEFKSVYAAVGLDADEAAEKSSKFMDAVDKLGFVMAAVGKGIAVKFMSKFTGTLDTLRKMVVEMLPQIMRIVLPIISTVLTLADVFMTLAMRAGQAVSTIVGWVMDIISATNDWVLILGAVAIAWRYLNLAFLATPIGMIISLAAAVALLVDDFMTWQEGGDSLIPWGEWEEQINIAKAIIGSLKDFLNSWFISLFAIVDAVVNLFRGDFQGALSSLQIAFESFFEAFRNLFAPIIAFVQEQFDAFVNYLVDVFEPFTPILMAFANLLSFVFLAPINMIKEQFSAAFDWIMTIIDSVMGKINGAVSLAGRAASALSGLFSSEDASPASSVASAATLGGGGTSAPAALAPSPSYSAGANQTVNQETNITIDGANNPQAVGQAVAGQQSRVNGDMARNMMGAAR